MRKFSAILVIGLVCLLLITMANKQPLDNREAIRHQPAGPIISAGPGKESPTKSKVAEVTRVTFVNGANYDSTVAKNLDPLTVAVREIYPEATFKVEGTHLAVGLNLQDAAKGEILCVNWKSDCPVNSIYQYSQPQTFASEILRPTLVAWTRIHHEHLGLGTADVKSYSEGEGRAEVILIRQ